MGQTENLEEVEVKHDETNEESQKELIPAPLASAPPPAPPPPPPFAPIPSVAQAPLPPPPMPPVAAPPRPSSIPTPPQMPQQQQHFQSTAVQAYQPMQNLYPTPTMPMPMASANSMPFQMPFGMPMFQQQQPQQQIQSPQIQQSFNPTFFINMATFMHKIQTATNKYQQEINTLVYEFQMNTFSSGNNFQIPNFQSMSSNYSQMPGPMMPMMPMAQYSQQQQQMYPQPGQIISQNPYSNLHNPTPPVPAFTNSTAPKSSQQNNSKPMAPPNLLEEIQAAGGIEFLRRKKSNAKAPPA
uniref:Uncharacterized protein n=1 Tax=Panagrolaimus sp. ES5 TaxID=591445 RepID=A0AC34F591_9BILA